MSVVADNRAIIMFLPCGVISFNRNDVAQRYCALCRRFIDNELSAAALPSPRSVAD